MSHPAKLSRTPGMVIGGKQTVPVKTLVSDEFKEDLTAFWRTRGYPSEGEFVRELLVVTVYGADHVADLHAQRIRALVRSTSDTGTTTCKLGGE